MKRRIMVWGVALFLSLPLLSQNWAGKFTELEGAVWVERSGEKISAQLGMELFPGDLIVTDVDSRARVWFRDHSVITLGENSKFKVQKLEYEPGTSRKSLFQLLSGRVRAWVGGWFSSSQEPDYQIRALSTVAGVRGTEFIIEIIPGEQGGIELYCLSGSLEVWSQVPPYQKITLNPGQFIRIGAGGGISNPFNLSPEEIKEIKDKFKWKKNGSRGDRSGKIIKLKEGEFLKLGGKKTGLLIFPSPELGRGDYKDPSQLIFQEPPGFTPVTIRIKFASQPQ